MYTDRLKSEPNDLVIKNATNVGEQKQKKNKQNHYVFGSAIDGSFGDGRRGNSADERVERPPATRRALQAFASFRTQRIFNGRGEATRKNEEKIRGKIQISFKSV